MKLIPAVRTVSAGTRRTGWLGHAGHGFPAAFGEEIRNFALYIFPPAIDAGHGEIGLSHRAQGFELMVAILADIFVNRHKYLWKEIINDDGRICKD